MYADPLEIDAFMQVIVILGEIDFQLLRLIWLVHPPLTASQLRAAQYLTLPGMFPNWKPIYIT